MLENPTDNPFPGMNPYLEDPVLWQGHHSQIINLINLELNQVLPLEYATRIEERVYVENKGKEYKADSAIVQTRPTSPAPTLNRGGTAVMERVETTKAAFDAPLTLEWGETTVREPFLEIRNRKKNSELVAVIEVLSPTNKEPGPGRDEYQNKQKELVNSFIHFVEIDLLRTGKYTSAPDEKRLREAAEDFDYLVNLHRGGRGTIYDCWPIALPQRLPRLPIPLASENEFILLDLQTVVNRVYQEGGFWRTVDYDDDPNPPLRGGNAEWADALLRERGLRPQRLGENYA